MKLHNESEPSRPRRHAVPVRRWAWLVGVSWSLLLVATNGWCQALRDNFAEREVATAVAGELRANNNTATIEPGEPLHGGKPGGHSMWISWIAPTNGLVRFETERTAFDTLLAAYYFPGTNDTALEQLVAAGWADDSEGFEHESEVKFGVLAGQRYEIAVDGYRGATGAIVLNWDFEPTTLPPPIVLATPADRAVNLGDPVTLTVDLANVANGRYRWYHNTNELDVETPTLVISSVQATNVGRYKLRVKIDGIGYFSPPVEVQVNTEGASLTLAQDKLFDAIDSALTPAVLRAAGLSAAAGVLRGYNGSQIFNTTFALSEPDEPVHCGVASGASYWFAYQPPTNGTATLDTIGSAFDTVLAVYTYDPPLTGYSGLMPIVCDNDAVAPAGASRVEFAAVKGRQYAVVVAGVGGVRGLAALHYHLDATRPPVAPTLLQAPAPLTVAAGTTVTLQPEIIGSAPLCYAWRKDGSIIVGGTNAALRIAPATPAHSGAYTVTVSNFVGSPLVVSTPLRVLVAPVIKVRLVANMLTLAVPTEAGQRYLLEQCKSLGGPWQPLDAAMVADGSTLLFTNTLATGNRYWRVRVE